MLILPFDSCEATIDNVGGKGLNLVRSYRAGFNVPQGFIITTQCYNEFVNQNHLNSIILSELKTLGSEPGSLERASSAIRKAFSSGTMPIDVNHELKLLHEKLENIPVAVRSSATLEDLSDLSFAGQQDTYLNILGLENLKSAVINCWSSLWTARAVDYRLRNHIPDDGAALAVIIQKMVQSEVSGVLFTANPLSGLLSETVIDATFGLGEALVSGQVEPDHFVVNSQNGKVKDIHLGSKLISTRAKLEGGVGFQNENAHGQSSLSSDQIQQLAALGQSAQKEFGLPQDIEWAFENGNLHLLQARPITSLFPIPVISFNPLIVWFSFGSVQGLVGPLTPLGQDAIRHVFAGACRLFDLHVQPYEIDIIDQAGGRIWIKISDFIRHPVGVKVFGSLLSILEPSIGEILKSLIGEPNLGAGKGKIKFSTLRRIFSFALPTFFHLLLNLIRPEKARANFDRQIENFLSKAKIKPGKNRFEHLAAVVTFMHEHTSNALYRLLPRFIPVLGPAMASFNLLKKLSGNSDLSFEITRSLPKNVTTEMDIELWHASLSIRENDVAREHFTSMEPELLLHEYFAGTLPPVAHTAIDSFILKYGMRGIGEIDMGQKRWREDPTPLINTIQSYLQIKDEFSPDQMFSKGESTASNAVEIIAKQVSNEPYGWLKQKLVRAAARRIRLLMGARESPKFFAIRMMGIARQALLEAGKEFMEAGTISVSDDLSYLTLAELTELSDENQAITRNWKALISQRRKDYQKEELRRQVPRVLVSDGRAFYQGLGSSTDSKDLITGSPVSPGVVEGIVHVVLDPRGVKLMPGEILVCPGTDPAWTPLFMVASGLITEVGGMMTHGSVVAREYGIPAVVGVHQATTQLKNGQKVKIDGTTGKIFITG